VVYNLIVGTMLRRVFRTQNPITGAIPGTGTAGMEAAFFCTG
jgi:aspartate aminotransferase-like enzyme